LQLATSDALTGLPNRIQLIERVEVAMRAAERSGRIFAVLFMDLDGFKNVNDSLGHSVGDRLLLAVAQRLRVSVSQEDIVARVFEALPDCEAAVACTANVLARMREPFDMHGLSLRVTPSMGIAVYPTDGDSVDALLQHADTAMYEAKQCGRNAYRFYEPAMNAAATRALQIQRDLERAMEQRELSLHFQAKFAGRQQKLVGAEALIRWHHREIGVIAPSEFGSWVIEEACRQLVHWDKKGLPQLNLALNLSPQQLRQPNFVEAVDAIVRRAGVAADRLTFEITETVAMEDVERTAAIIRAFQALGFDVAIDDFGAGYSSLGYLQWFQVKQLKVDRFFTEGLDKHGLRGQAIVSAIIELAHALDMDVVAEGVETDTQLNVLNALHCDQVQGYLLAKPLPPADFEQFVLAKAA
jgi:diguanylate cyclase